MSAYPTLLSGQQRQQGAAVHLSHQQLGYTKKKQSASDESWKVDVSEQKQSSAAIF